MHMKNAVRTALLIFVAGTLVLFLAQELQRPEGTSQPELQPRAAAVHNARVVVYYFMGNYRCYSCRKIEEVSHDAVFAGFAPELQSGELQWKSVNVDERSNRHFISEFQLFTRSLVIVKVKDGKQVGYKNLIRVWEFVDNADALTRYVQDEVRGYLQES